MSNLPSASTSLYCAHWHRTISTSSPSSLKNPFSTAVKIGASQEMPMSRRFADLTPYEGYEDAIVEKKDGVVVFKPGIRILNLTVRPERSSVAETGSPLPK